MFHLFFISFFLPFSDYSCVTAFLKEIFRCVFLFFFWHFKDVIFLSSILYDFCEGLYYNPHSYSTVYNLTLFFGYLEGVVFVSGAQQLEYDGTRYCIWGLLVILSFLGLWLVSISNIGKVIGFTSLCRYLSIYWFGANQLPFEHRTLMGSTTFVNLMFA